MSYVARILERSRVADGPPGSAYFWAAPDLLLGHDATVALLLDRFRAAGLSVRHPDRCLFAADHFVPPASAERATILRRYIDWLRDAGLDTGQLFQGICHQILLEDARLAPGLFVAGADSHTTTAGALGCAAAGFGSTDMLVAFGLGSVAVRVPEVVFAEVVGALDPESAVGTRDLALALMRRFGQGGLAYRALEILDRSSSGVGIATRASFANQAVDAGAKTCLWWPDQTTADFIEARDGSRPDPADWDLPDEPDRVGMERFDLELLEPLLARPGDPSDVVPVREAAGEAIHQAVIGSCAGGRIEDLREAAGVLAGRHIAAGVRLVVTPASQRVYLGAVREGLIEVMVAAGAIVTASSCAACGGIDKGLLGAAEVGISTSNRNFAGRMGHRDARIYLASARTVAASAVAGRVVDPREVLS